MAVGTAQLISTAHLLNITNGMGRNYDLINAQLGTSYSWAVTVLGRVVGETGTSYGVADRFIHANLDAGAQTFADSFEESTFWRNAVTGLLGGFETNISQYGNYVGSSISTLDNYATYANAAIPFSLTFCSPFAKLYYLYKSSAAMLSPGNVLSDSVTLGNGTVTGTTAITFGTGVTINGVNSVASGVQGYCADNFYLQMTGGTFTGTVTATGINQAAGTVTWSATGSAFSTGTMAFTPGTAGHRITRVIGLGVTGDATSASFDLKTVGRDLTL
jgi:hypothetical protein